MWITTNCKILQKKGIPEHLTCLLRKLYAGQEARVRAGHRKADWFQIGEGVHQGCMLSPSLFNLYAEYFMRNVGLDEAQVGIKINGRNINNLRYADEIMASGPITSWQIDGETLEAVLDYIFLGSKITADGDCSQEIKRCLLLGRKAVMYLDSILKSRDVTLLTKVHLVKAMFSSSHVWV